MQEFSTFGKQVCVDLPNKFHIYTQILQGNVLFNGKFYTAGKLFTR